MFVPRPTITTRLIKDPGSVHPQPRPSFVFLSQTSRSRLVLVVRMLSHLLPEDFQAAVGLAGGLGELP